MTTLTVEQNLSRLTETNRERHSANWSSWRATLKALYDGKPIDADDTNELLAAMNKTRDDLEAALEVYRQRLQVKARLDSVPKWTAEREKLAEEMAKLQPELERLRAIEAKRDDLARLYRQKAEAIAGAEMSDRNTLIRDCPYPDLRVRLAAIRAQQDQKRAAAQEQHRLVGDIDVTINETEARMERHARKHTNADEIPGLREKIQELKERRTARLTDAGRLAREADAMDEVVRVAEDELLVA